MSIDTTVPAGTGDSFQTDVAVRDVGVGGYPWYLRGRRLFAIWAALSILWVTAVGYDLYQRVSVQADMSRDVESDLDQGFVTASCVGPSCGSNAAQAVPATQNWMGIASTYVRFGSDEMAECVIGPPAILLLIGLGSAFALRRRRNAAFKSAYISH